MKPAWVAAAAMLALSPLATALAQNQLPTTNVTAPKPKPKPAVDHRAAPPRSATESASVLPEHPDPSHPRVRATDWNAPGVMNLHYMTDAQFAAFQAAHPTAVFFQRCFAGRTRT